MLSSQIKIFPELDQGWQLKVRNFRDFLLRPLVKLLAFCGIRPDVLSYVAFGMVCFFPVFFSFYPWISVGVLVVGLVLDGVDGALARFLKVESVRGSLLDRTLDHVGFLVVFFTLLYYEFFSAFWGGIYSVNYVILLFLLVILQSFSVKTFSVVRGKYFFYGMLLVWNFSGWNFFDPFIVVFSLYMIVVNYFLFRKLLCLLSS